MTTIKVSPDVRDRLKALGAKDRRTANEVVAALIDEHERHAYWDAYLRAAESDDGALSDQLEPVSAASVADLHSQL